VLKDMTLRTAIREMRKFILVWAGQTVSVIGSGLTGFALGVWVYQRTGSATQFALISFFAMLPGIIAQPFAGALADRWNRRKMVVLCDTGAGICTLIIALLIYSDRLEVWHIYILNAVNSIFSVSQGPAYTAAVTLLVPKRHLGRAGGMMQFSEAAGEIAPPVLAGVLMSIVNLWGIIVIDFATFLFAVGTMLLINIPSIPKVLPEGNAKQSLLRDAAYGWSYITTRPGLLGLLVFFAINNFLFGLFLALSTPLVLSFASAATLGTVLGVGGVGGLVGSFVMSVWGGPQRRVHGVLGFSLVIGFCIMLTGLRPSAILIGCAWFIISFCFPIVAGSSQAIWQSKVDLEVQGRVFAIRRMIGWSCAPLSFLLAGPLADYVFEPLLAEGGALAGSIGQLIGSGAGRGIGLLFLVAGGCKMLVVSLAYLYPPLRFVEDELSDVISDEAFATN
jgi:MFS family permease